MIFGLLLVPSPQASLCTRSFSHSHWHYSYSSIWFLLFFVQLHRQWHSSGWAQPVLHFLSCDRRSSFRVLNFMFWGWNLSIKDHFLVALSLYQSEAWCTNATIDMKLSLTAGEWNLIWKDWHQVIEKWLIRFWVKCLWFLNLCTAVHPPHWVQCDCQFPGQKGAQGLMVRETTPRCRTCAHRAIIRRVNKGRGRGSLGNGSLLIARHICKLKDYVDTFDSMNLVGSLVWKFRG